MGHQYPSNKQMIGHTILGGTTGAIALAGASAAVEGVRSLISNSGSTSVDDLSNHTILDLNIEMTKKLHNAMTKSQCPMLANHRCRNNWQFANSYLKLGTHHHLPQ